MCLTLKCSRSFEQINRFVYESSQLKVARNLHVLILTFRCETCVKDGEFSRFIVGKVLLDVVSSHQMFLQFVRSMDF